MALYPLAERGLVEVYHLLHLPQFPVFGVEGSSITGKHAVTFGDAFNLDTVNIHQSGVGTFWTTDTDFNTTMSGGIAVIEIHTTTEGGGPLQPMVFMYASHLGHLI
jgi:hypothetical protein